MVYTRVIFVVTVAALLLACQGASIAKEKRIQYVEDQINIVQRYSWRTLEKYKAKYIPKSAKTISLNLSLVEIAKKTFTLQENSSKTANAYILQMIKIINTFIEALRFTEVDTINSNVSQEIRQLLSGVKDLRSMTIKMYFNISGQLYQHKYTPNITRAALDKKVIAYKLLSKDKLAVNVLRNFVTIYDVKYKLINELEMRIDKIRDILLLF